MKCNNLEQSSMTSAVTYFLTLAFLKAQIHKKLQHYCPEYVAAYWGMLCATFSEFWLQRKAQFREYFIYDIAWLSSAAL